MKSGFRGHGLVMMWCWLFAFAGMARAQHSHLNAGAIEPAAGSRLYFANGANFVADSGYTLPLKAVTNGPFAGFHRGTITFTSLPATSDYGGPAFGHAAPGAHLVLQVERVAGPVGGAFAFWENEDGELGTHLTFTVPVGEAGGTNRFDLSENDGSADTDPFGHIHGRSYGATLPGLYTVGFRILDTSANGTGGGPLHPPSEIVPIYFQAGVTIADVAVGDAEVTVRFAALKGGTYHLETAADPSGPWQTIGDPVVGKDHLESIAVPRSAAAYFRLRVDGL